MIYIQIFLYGVGETQQWVILFIYVMLVGRILGRLERLDLFFFYLFFLIFMVFSYFSTAGQIFAPFFFPNFTSLLLFYFLVDEKIAYFCSTTVSKNLLNTFPDGTINPLSTWNNQPTHLTTRELIKFIFQLLFFSSFFLLSCRKRMRVNSEDDVNLVNREQPLGKQTKSVQVHFEIDNLICISSSLQPSLLLFPTHSTFRSLYLLFSLCQCPLNVPLLF